MSVSGVRSVDIDFATKVATVTMKPGTSLTKETCDRAFEGSNYSVKSFAAR